MNIYMQEYNQWLISIFFFSIPWQVGGEQTNWTRSSQVKQEHHKMDNKKKNNEKPGHKWEFPFSWEGLTLKRMNI